MGLTSAVQLQAKTIVLHIKPSEDGESQNSYLYGKWGVDVNANYSHSRASSSAISRFLSISNKPAEMFDIVVEPVSLKVKEKLDDQPSVARLSHYYDEALFSNSDLNNSRYHKVTEAWADKVSVHVARLLNLDRDNLAPSMY